MSDPSLVERKKRMNGCVMAIIACVVLLLLVICLYWVWTIRCDREFADQLKEIQDRGEPVTAEEADAFYDLPDGMADTTDLWKEGTVLFEEKAYSADAKPFPIVGLNENDIPSAGESWRQLDDAKAFLDRYGDQFDTMHAAAEIGGAARFHREFSQGFTMILDDVQRMRQAAGMLHLNSRVQAHRGEADKVAQSLNTMVRLSEATRREPILVSQMVRTALIGVAANATAEALGDVTFTDAQLVGIQNTFRNIQLGEGYRRAMIGERLMAIQMMKQGFQEDQSSPTPQTLLFKFVKQDTSTYFDTMARYIKVMDKPFPDAMAEMEKIRTEVESLRGPRQMLSQMALPSFTRIPAGRTRGESLALMAVAAAGVKRFELAEGHLPKDLSELVPKYLDAVPQDPFDLKPMRYRVGDDGTSFHLHCVAADGVDDGGDPNEEELDHVLSVGVIRKEVAEDEKEMEADGLNGFFGDGSSTSDELTPDNEGEDNNEHEAAPSPGDGRR